MTREAFENAISVLLAMGGSLNACLHLPAIAHELGIDLPMTLFDDISRRVPFLAGVTPNNQEYTTNDLQRAGGMKALMKELGGLLHTGALTVTGDSVENNMRTQRFWTATSSVRWQSRWTRKAAWPYW